MNRPLPPVDVQRAQALTEAKARRAQAAAELEAWQWAVAAIRRIDHPRRRHRHRPRLPRRPRHPPTRRRPPGGRGGLCRCGAAHTADRGRRAARCRVARLPGADRQRGSAPPRPPPPGGRSVSRVADGAWTDRRSPAGVDRNRLRIKADQRAKQRLVDAHRAEFEQLRSEERRKLGLGAHDRGGGDEVLHTRASGRNVPASEMSDPTRSGPNAGGPGLHPLHATPPTEGHRG